LDLADRLLSVFVEVERGRVFIQPVGARFKSPDVDLRLPVVVTDGWLYKSRSKMTIIGNYLIEGLQIKLNYLFKYLPPTTLALRYFLSECMVCQNLISVRISSLKSALGCEGHLGARQK